MYFVIVSWIPQPISLISNREAWVAMIPNQITDYPPVKSECAGRKTTLTVYQGRNFRPNGPDSSNCAEVSWFSHLRPCFPIPLSAILPPLSPIASLYHRRSCLGQKFSASCIPAGLFKVSFWPVLAFNGAHIPWFCSWLFDGEFFHAAMARSTCTHFQSCFRAADIYCRSSLLQISSAALITHVRVHAESHELSLKVGGAKN